MLCMSLGLVSQGTVCGDPSRTRCCRSPCLWSASLDPATFHHLSAHTGLWPQNSLRLLEESPLPALPCSLNPLPISDAEKLIGQVKQICKMCDWGLAPLLPSCPSFPLPSVTSPATRNFPITVNFAGAEEHLPSSFVFVFVLGGGP